MKRETRLKTLETLRPKIALGKAFTDELTDDEKSYIEMLVEDDHEEYSERDHDRDCGCSYTGPHLW
jgi:hypothetical protein